MAKQSQQPRATGSTSRASGSSASQAMKATGDRARAGRASGRGRRVRGRTRNQYLMWWVIGAVAVVVIGIIALNWQSLFGGARGGGVSVVGEGTSWGPAGATVQIVEYSNFGCSHCQAFAQQNGKRLYQEYKDTGKVHFVFKPFKLANPAPDDAANAAYCAADQGKFWDYHDRLFLEQNKSAQPFSKANLKQYGKDLGLDSAKFEPCVDNNQHMDAVDQAAQEGLGQHVEGTPTFFINGTPLVGDVPYEQLKAAVDGAGAKS